MAPRNPDQYKTYPLEIPESDLRDYYYNVMAACRGEEEQIVRNDQVLRIMKLMESPCWRKGFRSTGSALR